MEKQSKYHMSRELGENSAEFTNINDEENQTYKQLIVPVVYPVSTKANQNSTRRSLGEKNERKCIYCGKSHPETTFKKDAHIIPASLGNRIFYNYNECDRCNEDYFSVHENELANFLMLDRIFIGSNKRIGLPKYKPISKGNTSIEHSSDNRTININLDEVENRFEIFVDEQNHEVSFIINDSLPYRPADLCKALVHMIWPFLSEEYREKLSYVPKWLENKVTMFPLFLDVLFVPGNGFTQGILEVWESRDSKSEYPLIVRFTFGLKILSFFIPSSPVVSSEPNILSTYIQLPEDEKEMPLTRMTIISDDRVKPKNLSYTMKFKNASKLTKVMENHN